MLKWWKIKRNWEIRFIITNNFTMKNHKFVVMFIAGILIIPCIVSASITAGTPISNFIHTVEAIILVSLLIIGLWKKPKSKFGIVFVGIGVIQLFQAGDMFKKTMFYYNPMTPVPGIGSFVGMILGALAILAIYYYIGRSLGKLCSKLYSKFISEKNSRK